MVSLLLRLFCVHRRWCTALLAEQVWSLLVWRYCHWSSKSSVMQFPPILSTHFRPITPPYSSSCHWPFSSSTWSFCMRCVERHTALPPRLDVTNTSSQPRPILPFLPSCSSQSTSSNSTVPTIMLVTTSVIYVFLCSTWSFLHIISKIWLPQSRLDIWNTAYAISIIMQRLIFIYNFFVYVITGKQFRSELRSIFCCCASTAAAAANDDDAARIPRHG